MSGVLLGWEVVEECVWGGGVYVCGVGGGLLGDYLSIVAIFLKPHR